METKEITIKIRVNVSENTKPEAIDRAIEKGLYWGLDVKNIANPQNLEIVSITQTK